MRHGIDLKPIHNVKDAGQFPASQAWISPGRISCFHLWSVLPAVLRSCAARRPGGAYRDRTDDLKLAKLALSQLS